MDNSEYVRSNAEKLRDYFMLGYHPGRNLFYTYETADMKFTAYNADAFVDGLFRVSK